MIALRKLRLPSIWRRREQDASRGAERGAAAIAFAILLPTIVLLVSASIGIGSYMAESARLGHTINNLTAVARAIPARPTPEELGVDGDTAIDERLQALPELFRSMVKVSDPRTYRFLVVEYRRLNATAQIVPLVDEGTLNCNLHYGEDLLSQLDTAENLRLLAVYACQTSTLVPGVILERFSYRASRVLPTSLPITANCHEIAANTRAKSGIYLIDPDGAGLHEPFPVYCALDEPNSGWTLVAAQFEKDPADWNEGRKKGKKGYDPTLGGGYSFALSEGDIPPHTEIAIGLGTNPRAGVVIQGRYTTGDIPLSVTRGDDGALYHIYRSHNSFFVSDDPDLGQLDSGKGNDTLLVDRIGGRGGWVFSPKRPEARERGRMISAEDRSQDSDVEPWTIWVR